jgi:hypothetical protein
VLLLVAMIGVTGIQASLPLSLDHKVAGTRLNVHLCLPSFSQMLGVLSKAEREPDDI